jgi:defect in organelle trafficking protein DotB
MSICIKLPATLNERTLDGYLLEVCDIPGLSDVLFQSDDYVFAKIHNVQTRISDRRLDHNEAELICVIKYGKSAISLLNAGGDLNFRCEVMRSLSDIVSFRANATRGRIGELSDGVSITMRYVTDIPRSLESLGLEQEILDNLFPQYGLVLIVGTTGSGKSTILSSANRFRLESRQDKPVKIICYEDPIEYTYQTLGSGVMPKAFQAEIGTGRHLGSFEQAGPNAMRRGADVIVLGEMRDLKSVEAGFELAMTGHCVYANLHVETPAQVIDRIVSFFPFDAQPAAASKLRSVLRTVVAQKQFATKKGSARVRSWCVFDRVVNDALSVAKYHDWERIITKICLDRASGFELKAMGYLERGEIDMESFCTIAGFTRSEGIIFCQSRGLDVSHLD